MIAVTTRVKDRVQSLAWYAALVFTAVVVGGALSSPSLARAAIAGSVALVLLAMVVRRPTWALFALVGWLAALGMLRRITTGISGEFSLGDPLLLVEPAVLGAVSLVACRRGALRVSSGLGRAVLLLTFLLAASAANPMQGGIEVGLSGVALVVVPMLAFLVGRTFDARVVGRILVLVATFGVVAAAYGLYQTFVGFPWWDQQWIVQSGYVALRVGDNVVRPFASFASGQEFGTYCAIGLVVLLAMSHGLQRAITIPVGCILALGVWYQSGRAILVFLVLAIAFMIAARSGWSIARGLVVGLLVLLALPSVVSALAPDSFSDTAGGQLASHQVSGLVDPFNDDSTVHDHIELALDGIRAIREDPLGRGVGSVTTAAERLGGTVAGTETDIGNAAVAAGALGLLLYLIIAVAGLARAFRVAARTRAPLAVAALGVLVVTFQHWLTGGMYAVAWLPWLVLGWLDQRSSIDLTPEPGPEQPAATVVPLRVVGG